MSARKSFVLLLFLLMISGLASAATQISTLNASNVTAAGEISRAYIGVTVDANWRTSSTELNGTEATTPQYSSLRADDGTRISMFDSDKKLIYAKFNFTIKSYASINWLNFSLDAAQTIQQTCDATNTAIFIWNTTSSNWDEKLNLSLSTSDKLFTFNTSAVEYVNASTREIHWMMGCQGNTGLRHQVVDYAALEYSYSPILINLSLVAPTRSNGTYTVNFAFVNVTADSNSGQAIDTCTLEWNSVNETMTKHGSGNSVFCSTNKTSLSSANYTYRVFVNDSQNALNASDTRHYFADSAGPVVTFVNPTLANNTYNQPYFFVNVTSVDAGATVDVCLLELNGVNQSMTRHGSGSSVFCSINKTQMPRGNYTYRVWSNDSFGNFAVGPTRHVFINYTTVVQAITVGLSVNGTPIAYAGGGTTLQTTLGGGTAFTGDDNVSAKYSDDSRASSTSATHTFHRFNFTLLPYKELNWINFTVEGDSAAGDCTGAAANLSVWNYTGATWTFLAQGQWGAGDGTTTVNISGAFNDYVNSSDRQIHFIARCQNALARSIRVDYARLQYSYVTNYSVFSAIIVSTADDAHEGLGDTGFDRTQTYVDMTSQSSAASTLVGGYRFTNVTIPRGAQVHNAFIMLNVVDTLNDDPNVNLTAEAVDNSSDFAATADVFGRARTSSKAFWSETAVGAGWDISPDVQASLQEVFARSGWVQGNAFTLFVQGVVSSPFSFTATSYDGNPSLAANITIFYSEGANVAPVINNATLNVVGLGGPVDLRILVNATDANGANELSQCWVNNSVANATFVGDFCSLDIGNSLSQSIVVLVNDTSNATAAAFSFSFALSNATVNYTASLSQNSTLQVAQLNNTLNFTGGSPFLFIVNYSAPSYGGAKASNLSAVNISGSLSPTSNATIFANWSGDWINETRFNHNITNATGNVTLGRNSTGYIEANIQNLLPAAVSNLFVNISALMPSGWSANASSDEAYLVNLTSSQASRVNTTIKTQAPLISELAPDASDCLTYTVFSTHCELTVVSSNTDTAVTRTVTIRHKVNVTQALVRDFQLTMPFPLTRFTNWVIRDSGSEALVTNVSTQNTSLSSNSTDVAGFIDTNHSTSSLTSGIYLVDTSYTFTSLKGASAPSDVVFNIVGNAGNAGNASNASNATKVFVGQGEWLQTKFVGRFIKANQTLVETVVFENPNEFSLELRVFIEEIAGNDGYKLGRIAINNSRLTETLIVLPPGSRAKPSVYELPIEINTPTLLPESSYKFNVIARTLNGTSQKATPFELDASTELNILAPFTFELLGNPLPIVGRLPVWVALVTIGLIVTFLLMVRLSLWSLGLRGKKPS